MSDWKAGDKALCIKTPKGRETDLYPGGKPKEGTIYLVDQVRPYEPSVGLHIRGMPTVCGVLEDCAWCSSNFRKIVPQCDREEITQEERITELIEIKYPNLA